MSDGRNNVCVSASNTVPVSDAMAEVSRDTHDGGLKTMSGILADVQTTHDAVQMLGPPVTGAPPPTVA